MKSKKIFIIICAAAVLISSGAADTVIDKTANVKLFASQDRRVEQKDTIEYIVKKGDSLWAIAIKYVKPMESEYNVIEEIKFVNNIKEGIVPGQKLIIPIR